MKSSARPPLRNRISNGSDEFYFNQLSAGFQVGSLSYFGFRRCRWCTTSSSDPVEQFHRSFKFLGFRRCGCGSVSTSNLPEHLLGFRRCGRGKASEPHCCGRGKAWKLPPLRKGNASDLRSAEGEKLGSFRRCGREMLPTSDLRKEKILEASAIAEGKCFRPLICGRRKAFDPIERFHRSLPFL